MLDQTGSEVLIKGGVHLFGQNRVDAMRPGGDNALPSGTEFRRASKSRSILGRFHVGHLLVLDKLLS